MNTSRYIIASLVGFVVIVASDMIWHAWLMADFYSTHLAAIGGTLPGTNGAPLFLLAYELIIAFIVTYFILASGTRTWWDSIWKGALLAFVGVGCANFLNHTLFPGWDTTLMVADIGWALVMGAITGIVVTWIGRGKMA